MRRSGNVRAVPQAGRRGKEKAGFTHCAGSGGKVLMLASVASMIDQFNMPNIRLLLDLGFEVHVACNFREGNTCDEQQLGRLVQRLRGMRVTLHQWDCPRGVSSIKKCCAAYRQLHRLAGRCRFDWMHCHSPVGGALARLVAQRHGIRVVYTAHGFHFYQGAPLKNWLLYYPVEKLLAYWTDVLITVNREDYCFARRYLKAGKICYIPGAGIDPEKFRASGREDSAGFRKKYGIPDNAVLLLSVGELSRRKNHSAVLRALAYLETEGLTRRENVYYLICGQGPLKKKLLRQAREYGICGRVRMPGFVEDVAAAYRAADIFVFPSYQEGMPVALMEAMAAGMPCIVSDIRGNRELISWKGMRFAPDSPKQLAALLAQLLWRTRAQRDAYGAANREKIRAYSLETVLRRMKRIYTQCRDGMAKE